MPYAPGVVNHGGEYIANGIQIAGAAMADAIGSRLEEHDKAKREEDYLQGVAPYYFAEKPDVMAKFLQSGVSAKRGMITAAQADEHHQQQQTDNQFKTADLNYKYYTQQAQDQRQVDDRAHDFSMLRERQKGASPVPVDLGGGEKAYSVPLTGQVIRPAANKPTVPDGSLVKDASGNDLGVYVNGKFVPDSYSTVMDVNTGSQQLINTRTGQPKSGGAGAGGTAAAAPAQPSIPAAPAGNGGAPASAQFTPGKVYVDGKGNRAKYNPDGTWSPVR